MKLVRRSSDDDICKRYRPQKLSEVYGNETQLKAIKNAFLQGKSRHKAILLAGSVGTGKTTKHIVINI